MLRAAALYELYLIWGCADVRASTAVSRPRCPGPLLACLPNWSISGLTVMASTLVLHQCWRCQQCPGPSIVP